MKTTYQPQLIYRVLALISLVLICLYIWSLLHGIQLGAVLYLAISMSTLVWTGYKGLTSLSVDESHFTLRSPFRADTIVEYRQIISVSEERRLMPTVVVNYHPREENGLLDLDTAESISFPAMKNQEQLFSLLQEKTPA